MIMLNNNLRTFITVAELESLTEAAKKLYISQPAVSQSIKKLEEELGISTSPYMELDRRPLMQDRMVSICRDNSNTIDLKNDSTGLVLCRVAYESITEQLSGRGIDLSHCLVVEAASTQINFLERVAYSHSKIKKGLITLAGTKPVNAVISSIAVFVAYPMSRPSSRRIQ